MWFPILVIAWTLQASSGAARPIVGPNRYLGTCLTAEWVASMEATLKINASDRDTKGRRMFPHLHAALTYPRHYVDDPRTMSPDAYSASCTQADTVFYGVGSEVDPAKGTMVKAGSANGSLVIELNAWTSDSTHSLASLVFGIIASEVYGYPVSMYATSSSLSLTERMSTAPAGICTPTHVNLEVWPGKEALLRVYANESSAIGPIGADFWRDYALFDDMIEAVSYEAFASDPTRFPTKPVCEDNKLGCQNHCAKSNACKLRESGGGKCLVVVLMSPTWDPGYLQAAMSNLNIPAYFCFLGYSLAINYILDSQQAKRPILFYHYEPDLFHFNNAGLFQRVLLPRPIPERVQLNTGTFGEKGYGEPTTNPVDVDFPAAKLAKYAASLLQNNQPIGGLVSKFAVQDLDMNFLLRKYIDATNDVNGIEPNFRAACDWVQNHYSTWSEWLDRLPLCTMDDHMQYQVAGCNGVMTGTDPAESMRVISFKWARPDPSDSSKPYNCDGGLDKLPTAIQTSRTCEWIEANPSKWKLWIQHQPECQPVLYKYNVTACDPSADRTVKYWWLLPDPQDASKSLECTGGDVLPPQIKIPCEYMPTSAPAFVTIAVLGNILMAILVVAIWFVIYHRDKPIVKRSQFELLVVMIIGGIIVCISALLYAGKPSNFLCGARPFFISTGFTTIFGALIVKSLRVYRVFMKTALKRVTVTVAMMFKIFAIFVCVDLLILSVWFIVDFPHPTITNEHDSSFGGNVDRITCKSSSFLFTAVLMFWKAIVLFMGIYLSFLIRRVSADFQESTWIFASSVAVLLACLVILPLAYMVQLSASAFYMFLACSLLLATAGVMGMMLIPKMFRLNQISKSSKYASTDTSAAGGDHTHIHSGATVAPHESSTTTVRRQSSAR
ncbi:hypothetical protein Poli38472_007708 [Pythium oligandrum]|uniref:G-protein coupled receptors family 3 profile domain-containing protein n=1 Tax=Pythium oligandrum TaxID=41045 RepID=A0A8K1CSW2_PYTOL|nr:hypothetical protein Poli38472_007708 [Pythium oligandrum]|eukprot:TMW68036.1 hypothetical protein Poli38472_007708 [Pythium oligandrum]